MTADGPAGRGGGALALLCAVQFVVVLDSTITNVALDSIRLDLHIDESTLQYVVSLYAVTFGGLLILGGRTGDLIGRRRTFAAGTGLFGVASLACGLAGSAPSLLGARAVQGAGAAFVSATAFALLLGLFPEGASRNRALGVWSALGASGAAAGLVLGGVLTDLAGWQWVFLVNVPVCGLALLLVGRLLPEDQPPRPLSPSRRGGMDLPGTVAVTLGLGMLIHGVTLGQRDGLDAPGPVGTLAVAALLLAGFLVIERRAAAPLVPLRIFAVGPVGAASLAILCLMAVVGSQGFFLVLYLQRVMEQSPVRSGLTMVPAAMAAFLGSSLATRLVARWPAPVLTAVGLGLVGVGQVLLSRIPVDGSFPRDLLPGLLLFGLGLGTTFVAATVLATSGVSAVDRGVVSGVVNTAQQVGLAVGVAALVGVAVGVTARRPDAASPAALVAGYRYGLALGAVIAVTGAVAVLAGTRKSTPVRTGQT